ncbi:MAG: GWxTD domain-containing protein [Acidobacteria bacterium]|nr:GWxTD domain-containing protein [Acidobacteriota bacterium]
MEWIEFFASVSLRVCGLTLLGALCIAAFRITSASARHAVWSAVLFSLPLLYPLLPPLPLRILPATAPPSAAPLRVAPPPVANPTPARRSSWPPSWEQSLLGLYGLGAGFFLIQLAAGYRFTRRIVNGAKPVPSALGGTLLVESEDIQVPMTAGAFQPRILLPAGWREWPEGRLRSVLAHEESHVRRQDWAVALGARLLRSLLWFHPLVWWLERKLASLAEQACDDEALLSVEDRGLYAQALLDIAADLRDTQSRFLSTAMAQSSRIGHRLDAILDESRTIPKPLRRGALPVLAAAAMVCAMVLGSVQLAPANQQASPLGPYSKWLNEDVVYIISDQEREAFLQLRTDEEREQFIVQFWQRRDPTPATMENEYKEEHYRRIRYANERFRGASIAGWRTDRGRTYILYGPPDEIESHPSGGSHESLIKTLGPQAGPTSDTSPFEMWRYTKPGWIFGFVDRERNGNYTMILVDSNPVSMVQCAPEYTEYTGVQGSMSLSLTIGTDGTAQNIRVTRSLRPDHDQRAIECARMWRWYPAIRNGKPVAFDIELHVSFHPKN